MATRLNVKYRKIDSLRAYKRNARTHPKKQLKQLATSIKEFGFINPLLITRDGELIAGHGRWEAAKLAGLNDVPTIVIDDLTAEQRRAYVLADNKLALNAGWDTELLALELGELADLGLGELAGFSTAEIDLVLDSARAADAERDELAPEDAQVDLPEQAVTRPGDLWQLGRHVLLCGDAREAADLARVTLSEDMDAVFTDPPYNCKIDGHVCGLGKVKHREFAMASGEMSEDEFRAFLEVTLGNAAERCKDGAIAFVCMDWRGMGPLVAAGRTAFTEHKQLCVWAKRNGGMGSFYRSQHELVFVYKVGTAPHTNNFGLGDTGRYRTNVWSYPGISSIGSDRDGDFARHPTPKLVAMIAEALRDVTRRGGLVLDPFAGGGSTMIAAELCGRAARLIEFDPIYCDGIITRFERYTGQKATLMTSNETFEDVGELRLRKDVA
jgi:ParB-like chromosome segregation protein Spo0J